MENQSNRKLDIEKLNRILEYKNEDVIDRFMEKYSVDEEESIKIFQETKKWLWLCVEAKHVTKYNFFIDDSMLIIDEMWHNFVLFTKNYVAFCNNFFGHYVHHQPTTKAEKNDWKDDFTEKIEKHKENLKIQYEFVYDYLGEQTLLTWYDEFANKYTKDYIKSITK